MKNIIVITLITFFNSMFGFAQRTKKELISTSLEIGTPLPDIPLGKIVNNQGLISNSFQGKTKFSEFRGKVIVLDFWATNCSSCIEGFPKMSKLQEQFKDQIQIFLVNPTQGEARIMDWLAIQKKTRSKDNPIIPKNLPMIVEAENLNRLFPLRSEIGYHVWIGIDGKVVLRGISHNTHEKKIRELLEGRNITFIQDYTNNKSNAYDAKEVSFFIGKEKILESSVKYSTSFSKFINNHLIVSPHGNNIVENLIDSVCGTVRTTLTNTLFLDFYNIPLREKIRDSPILFGPKTSIETKDSTIVVLKDDMYVYNKQRSPKTDEEFYTKRFCYEQIVPITISEEKRKQMMLEDLNRYFANELGIVAGMENREVSGLLLKISHPEKLMKSKFQEASRKGKTIDGKYIEEHYGVQLKEFLRDYIKGLSYNKISYNGSIIDDLKYSDKVDLILPPRYDIQGVEELKSYLNKYGIDLVPGKKVVEMLVIKDIPKKANELR